MGENVRSCLFLWLFVALVWMGESFQFHQQQRHTTDRNIKVPEVPQEIADRREMLKAVGMTFFAVAAAPQDALAKSYSSNARNMERMNSGDMSGGSLYDNNPTSEAGKKRRAMVGCKNNVAREEAAENSLKISSLSEKDCNGMVIGGETEFMLQALRTLDCPSCPYGISGKRN